MLTEILTLKEAAALLQIPAKTLREAATKGEVPGRRIARQWRFSRFALHHWLSGSAAPTLETRLRHAGILANSPLFAEVMANVEANRSAERGLAQTTAEPMPA
jgi:excisionase family DNA binding protein